jgi:aminocarboxymuconate-semialdehyde decarboxylase
MDRLGIAQQVISPPPVMFSYWADAQPALEFAQRQNDAIAAFVAERPGRFRAAGIVPLQSPDLAVRELERLKGAGFACVEIGSNVAGADLDDPRFLPFFQAASQHRMSLFVHPVEPPLGVERMPGRQLPLMVGFPLETSLCISRLLLGGVFEQVPSLKMCFAHGGGAFLCVASRVDWGWRRFANFQERAKRAPLEMLPQLYFDSITLDLEILKLLIERAGADKVVLGSDYPFLMGPDDPQEILRGLSPELQGRIATDNAREFLGE